MSVIWSLFCWYWLAGMLCSAVVLLNGAPLTAAVDGVLRRVPQFDRAWFRWFVVLVCVFYIALQWPKFIPAAYRVLRNLSR